LLAAPLPSICPHHIGKLLKRRATGWHPIETTGLADPWPVAHTFFCRQEVVARKQSRPHRHGARRQSPSPLGWRVVRHVRRSRLPLPITILVNRSISFRSRRTRPDRVAHSHSQSYGCDPRNRTLPPAARAHRLLLDDRKRAFDLEIAFLSRSSPISSFGEDESSARRPLSPASRSCKNGGDGHQQVSTPGSALPHQHSVHTSKRARGQDILRSKVFLNIRVVPTRFVFQAVPHSYGG